VAKRRISAVSLIMTTQEIPLVGYQSQLLNRVEVAEGTMAFHFEKPPGFDFKPGQSVDLTLLNPPETDSEGNVRTFSIASAPFEDQLRFATRMRDTAFKRSLKNVPLGTVVKMDSAMGSFTLHKNSAKPAVFLAGGIGITPFSSIVRQADHGPGAAQVVSVLFQPAARGRALYRSPAESGEDKPKFPFYCHDDGDAAFEENLERRDRADQQRNAVQAFE